MTPSDKIRLAKTDAPEPGQRAWMMKATMKDGKIKTATYDLLNGRISAAQFVMSALKSLDPFQVEDYSVWVVM
jgi:hypothetical protein